MCGLFAEILGLERVGIDENFFELGGHSLLAVWLMDRIEQMCGRRVPVSALFECATIERLTEFILRGYEAPPDGIPTEHVPTRRAAARERFAELLEAVTSND